MQDTPTKPIRLTANDCIIRDSMPVSCSPGVYSYFQRGLENMPYLGEGSFKWPSRFLLRSITVVSKFKYHEDVKALYEKTVLRFNIGNDKHSLTIVSSTIAIVPMSKGFLRREEYRPDKELTIPPIVNFCASIEVLSKTKLPDGLVIDVCLCGTLLTADQ